MSPYGDIDKYEHAIYTFTVTRPMIPRLVYAHAPDSDPRDFLIIPEVRVTETFPLLTKLPYSRSFNANFTYLGGDPLELTIQEADSTMSVSHLSFAIARWKASGTSGLPDRIFCLSQGPALNFDNEVSTEIHTAYISPSNISRETSS